MLLYYITDRKSFAGDEKERQRRILEKVAEAANCKVDYIQLREKDLPARDLEALASRAVEIVCGLRAKSRHAPTRILINSRTDVALAAGADGVHLPARDLSPAEVHRVWKSSGAARSGPVVGVSCHAPSEVAAAAAAGATYTIFGPVFDKRAAPGTSPAGIDALREACAHKIPVLAIGGVNLENARSCLEVGAAGLAAIRLFQENQISQIVEALRQASPE